MEISLHKKYLILLIRILSPLFLHSPDSEIGREPQPHIPSLPLTNVASKIWDLGFNMLTKEDPIFNNCGTF